MDSQGSHGEGTRSGTDPVHLDGRHETGTDEVASVPERDAGARKRRVRAHGETLSSTSARSENGRSGGDFLESLKQKLQVIQADELPDDNTAAKKWPALWSILTHFRDLEDKRCDGGAISVFPRGSVWAWSVRSPSLNVRLSGECQYLEEMLDVVEVAIRDPGSSWKVLDQHKADRLKKNQKKS